MPSPEMNRQIDEQPNYQLFLPSITMSSSEFPASVDEYTASIEVELLSELRIPTVDKYTDAMEAEFMSHIDFDFFIDAFGIAFNEQEEAPERERKVQAANAYPYSFGDVWKANWYVLFLNNSAHEWMYFLSLRD